MKQLSDARERHKREIRENKMRRVQLAESCAFFKSNQKTFSINKFYKKKSFRHQEKIIVTCLKQIFFHSV